MDTITLLRSEYEEIPEGVKALVSTIVDKLPLPQRKKYEPVKWQALCTAKERELIQDGIDARLLSQWLTLSAANAESGRSYRVIYQQLVEFERLRLQYTIEPINQALGKVLAYQAPAKCTIPYLRTILRTLSPPTALKSEEGNAARNLTPEERWAQVAARLKVRINPRSWATWLKDVEYITYRKEGVLVLRAFDQVAQEWITRNYLWIIVQEWALAGGQTIQVVFAPQAAQQ